MGISKQFLKRAFNSTGDNVDNQQVGLHELSAPAQQTIK